MATVQAGEEQQRDPASAFIDRQTEDALYRLYRDYFAAAEDERRWNIWNDIAWDSVVVGPSDELLDAVLFAYRGELFLPDYSARALQLLRGSRASAWFITRWSYEEGKHLLALSEWLMRSGAFTNDALRDMSDDLLLTNRWLPPFEDAPAVFVESLLWEIGERDRYRALRRQAEQGGDTALVQTLTFLLRDEDAQLSFFRDALSIIATYHAAMVVEAARRVAADQEDPETTRRLLAATLDLPAVAG